MTNTFAAVFTSYRTQFVKQKQLLLIVLAMFAAISTYAQTNITAVQNGPWNDPNTWGGTIPTQGGNQNAVIPAGISVTVPANASCVNLTVNGTLNMTGTGITMAIGNPGSNTGSLNIGAAGTLTVGASNFLDFKASQGGQRITVTAGGTFTSTGTNGSDAGTVLINAGSGADFEVTGNVNFYNIRNGSSGDGNWHLKLNTAGNRINGTLRAEGGSSWGFSVSGNAPIWGTASTFYADRANQGFSDQNAAWGLAWSVNTGTVGTTPGYPNNVTMVNMGSSQGGTGGVGWRPTGAVGLGGTLSAGSATTNGRISLENATSVNLGGILVDNNSLLVGPTIPYINRGNFTLQGATTGVFQSMTGGTINFAGSGTSGSPQIISTTGSSVVFANMQVSGGTYVRLDDPVSITTNLTLTSGVIATTNTNLLTISNTSTTTITGGSATAYIEGPLAWTIPATTTNNYVFPVGKSGTYLPFTISPNTTSGTVATVTAFNTGSGGSLGTDVTAISSTEYWSVSTSSPFTSGPLATAQRPAAVGTFNALGISTSPSGVYNTAGGTPNGGTPGIISNGGIGTVSPIYVAMIRANLTVVKLSGTNYGCNGTTGSITVGGSAGTPPYMYSIDGGGYVASGNFTNLTAGDHVFRVRDATMTISAPVIIKVLGSVVINGDNKDILICPTPTTALTATNLQNTTPVFQWADEPTFTPVDFTGSVYNVATNVDPSPTKTYYVRSDLYTNNLMAANGGFEDGNITNYTTTYTLHTGAAYGTTPGNNGYYSVSNEGRNQCQFFTIAAGGVGPSLTPHSGAFYFIGDGAIAGSNVLSRTVTGLTIGRLYKFNYWYAAGDPDANQAQLRTDVTGGTLAAVAPTGGATVTATTPSAWTQATYTIAATATSVTVTIHNPRAFGNTNGNDFFIDDMEFLEPCTVTSSINVTVNCVLPVELLEFNARKQEQGALLTWSTASELNSAYYIIEKSADGITFAPVGRVEAAGNSHTVLRYSFTDASALHSGITYYRLAQYDIDGSVHYSDMRALQKDNSGDVLIVPNPSNGVFNVIFDRSAEFNSKITVVNMLGQIVYNQAESAGNVKNIDISALSAGAYYVHISSDEGVIVKKVIKE